MAKIDDVREVAVEKLIPYVNNAKIHSEEQVTKIAASIREFGFLNPIIIDSDFNVIAGHGRLLAAKKINLKNVPCLNVDGLTDAQRKAYILADNRLGESEWDDSLVELELANLQELDFDVSITGFDLGADSDWFETRTRYDNSQNAQEDQEYQDFVEKFEQKRTTDDCYTPDLVFDAVADFVSGKYEIDKSQIVRPFYPGGDYEKEKYPADCVVVDNPPFSILADIVKFYVSKKIKFYLFCSALTPFSDCVCKNATVISLSAPIVYENGAIVSTSFLTNLEKGDLLIKSEPELYQKIKEACDKIKSETVKELPKYEYPECVLTASVVGRFSRYGVNYEVRRKEGIMISDLDSMKEHGKAIFGKGILLSEKAAAEKAAAEKAAAEKAAVFVWVLSDREKEMQKGLGK